MFSCCYNTECKKSAVVIPWNDHILQYSYNTECKQYLTLQYGMY